MRFCLFLFQLYNLDLTFVPSIETWIIRNSTFFDKCIYDQMEQGDFYRGEHLSGFTSTELNFLGTVFEGASQSTPTLLTYLMKAKSQLFSRSAMKVQIKLSIHQF